MNCYFWASGQTALAMPDCPPETQLLFLNILMISSIYLISVNIVSTQTLNSMASSAVFSVLSFLFTKYLPYRYIYLNVSCIAITGNKILCLMPYAQKPRLKVPFKNSISLQYMKQTWAKLNQKCD